MSRTRESRAYDSRYDPVYTGPYSTMAMDPRVAAAASSENQVAGSGRFKYFRRPIMPRMNAVPPYILLAPTTAQETLEPVEFVAEPAVKDAEVQTVYRDSEAQTLPYSPDFVISEGADPELLLLRNLTHENGLPLGKKELEMILQARAKKEVENNLPPFTDEASMLFRKKLMEQQDTREFKLREQEIDMKREARLMELQRALYERDESNEFLASQRVEAMRQTRMEEREEILQKIRNKRIKVLRRLARQRNRADPLLTNGGKRDIIEDYFNRGSQAYAPVKRGGKDIKADITMFDIATRTAPLDNIGNLVNLEPAIPQSLVRVDNFSPTRMMSKTAPGSFGKPSSRAAEERLTSAAQRNLRNTKRDVEEMHQILLKKKRAAILAASRPEKTTESPVVGTADSLLNKRPKGRPVTPDLTVDNEGNQLENTHETQLAIILLQRLIRGRAVQNIMFEGRFRRRELIAELRSSEEIIAQQPRPDPVQREIVRKQNRDAHIRETTIDTVAGTVTSHLILRMSHEQERQDLLSQFEVQAMEYVEERRKLEAMEAGRRMRVEHEEAEEEAAEQAGEGEGEGDEGGDDGGSGGGDEGSQEG